MLRLWAKVQVIVLLGMKNIKFREAVVIHNLEITFDYDDNLSHT